MSQSIILPEGFVWGAGAPAYQVEAASNRFTEDILLASQLNLSSYRFSISWHGVQPGRRGEYNQVALDFYDRVIDCLLAKNIQPFVTLQQLAPLLSTVGRSDLTGRESGKLFAQYCAKMLQRYGDRVKYWTTFDWSWRAPCLDPQAVHHLLLAHGLAAQSIRAEAKSAVSLGIAVNLSPSEPLCPADLFDIHRAEAAWRKDCGMVLDPLVLGQYPEAQAESINDIKDGDLEIIKQNLDFLGINFCSRNLVSRLPEVHPEVHTPSLRNLLNRVSREYYQPALYVIADGAAFDDTAGSDGQILDERRAHYIRRHIEQCALALKDGVDLRGYFASSLLDNLELFEGYSQRSGLVYVDYKTQKRTVKESGRMLARVARNSGLFSS